MWNRLLGVRCHVPVQHASRRCHLQRTHLGGAAWFCSSMCLFKHPGTEQLTKRPQGLPARVFPLVVHKVLRRLVVLSCPAVPEAWRQRLQHRDWWGGPPPLAATPRQGAAVRKLCA